MELHVEKLVNVDPREVSTRCPHCGKEAIFSPVSKQDISIGSYFVCGQRVCPSPECRGHLFVVIKDGDLVESYPPIRIDFDTNNIPEKIRSTFEEALTCHSSCSYVAAAIMVRRTLEEICEDNSAEGENLKEKIKKLQEMIVLPKALLEAMDVLRVLGNDAAHIESKEFDSISEKELSIAIEVTKEILKGIYQHSELLSKLTGLKSSE